MNIRLGMFYTPSFLFTDPITGKKYQGHPAEVEFAKFNALAVEEQSQAAAQAKAYEDAQIAAMKADWKASVDASAEQGKQDYAFSQWKPEASAQKPSASLLPILAAAAAAFFVWKG